MKIAFFEIEGWEEKLIRDRFPHDDLFLTKEKLDEFHIPPKADFEVVSIFVDSRITERVLTEFPRVKLITTRSTGYDHIHLAECRKWGVAVASVPGYGDNTVAEFAFGLILNLTRKIYAAIDQIKETGSFSMVGLRGIDLKGKILGVVGTGRIGKEAIQIGNGFGMKVVAYDAYPNAASAKELGFTYLTLPELLATADITTIHCPLVDETRHLLNAENMKHLKKGSYLVNTARGPIVETAAVVDALSSGRLAGFAADVLEEEVEVKDEMGFLKAAHRPEELVTVIQNNVLMRMPNVLITPHIAFNSKEALRRILDTTFLNIEGFVDKKPVNIIQGARN